MGFRTVVVLDNDLAHEWNNDPDLGCKISRAATLKGWGDPAPREHFQYGEVVEQTHVDCQTVVFFDGYGGKPMAYSHWFRDQTEEQKNLNMLKALADALGYRVSKKTAKKD